MEPHGAAALVREIRRGAADELHAVALAAEFGAQVEQAHPAAALILAAPGVELQDTRGRVAAHDLEHAVFVLCRVRARAREVDARREARGRAVGHGPGVGVAADIKIGVRLVAGVERLKAQARGVVLRRVPPPALLREGGELLAEVAVVVIVDGLYPRVVHLQQADRGVVPVQHGLPVPAVDAEYAHEQYLDGHAVGDGGDGAALVLRGELIQAVAHPALHGVKALADGHVPALRLVVEIVHLLRPAVGYIAPGFALPDAHVYLPQQRRALEGDVTSAQYGPRGLHRAVQVAGVHGVYPDVLEPLRQGVNLLFAPGGYLAVPMPLSAAEEVALRLRVAYEVDACHCASSSVSVLWLTMGHE